MRHWIPSALSVLLVALALAKGAPVYAHPDEQLAGSNMTLAQSRMSGLRTLPPPILGLVEVTQPEVDVFTTPEKTQRYSRVFAGRFFFYEQQTTSDGETLYYISFEGANGLNYGWISSLDATLVTIYSASNPAPEQPTPTPVQQSAPAPVQQPSPVSVQQPASVQQPTPVPVQQSAPAPAAKPVPVQQPAPAAKPAPVVSAQKSAPVAYTTTTTGTESRNASGMVQVSKARADVYTTVDKTAKYGYVITGRFYYTRTAMHGSEMLYYISYRDIADPAIMHYAWISAADASPYAVQATSGK